MYLNASLQPLLFFKERVLPHYYPQSSKCAEFNIQANLQQTYNDHKDLLP